MIIVRETFVAKPGQASKLAKLLKGVMQGSPDAANITVMTDLTGQFNTVVIQTELKDIAAIDKRMQEYSQDQSLREKMSSYTDMYLTGSREIFQITE